MVSVVVPVYNRKELLLRAVGSVFEQTFREWELIVVDDGSTDGTRQLMRGLEGGRVRCLFQPHSGVSCARNLGVKAARYPWIAFLDSDDYWLPGKLKAQLQALQEKPQYDIVHTDEIWIRRGRRVNPKKIHRKYGGWIYPHCLPRCIVSPSSVLLHRRVLEDRGGFDESFPVCEDYELWLRLFSQRPVCLVPQALTVKTGGHSDQLSRSRWGMDRYRVRALLKIIESEPLTPLQKLWTARELVTKAAVLAQGAAKRRNLPRARGYQDLVHRWSGVAEQLREELKLGQWRGISPEARSNPCGDGPECRPAGPSLLAF